MITSFMIAYLVFSLFVSFAIYGACKISMLTSDQKRCRRKESLTSISTIESHLQVGYH